MRIDSERNVCKIIYKADMSQTEARDSICDVADKLRDVLSIGDIVRDGENISLCVRHRESFKQYLYENVFETKDFYAFIGRISKLVREAIDNAVDFRNICWDMDAIFVGAEITELEFVYAPNLFLDNKENKLADFLTIASLNVTEYDDKVLEHFTVCLRKLETWEQDLTDNPKLFSSKEFMGCFDDIINALCGSRIESTGFLSTIKEKLANIKSKFEGLSITIGNKRCNEQDACAIKTITENEFINDTEMESIIDKPRKVHQIKIDACEMLSNVCIESDKTTFVIGRNNFDENCKAVSRKHLEFQYSKGDWYIQDMRSTNGTFLNSDRLKPGIFYPITIGDIIAFADNRLFVTVSEAN